MKIEMLCNHCIFAKIIATTYIYIANNYKQPNSNLFSCRNHQETILKMAARLSVTPPKSCAIFSFFVIFKSVGRLLWVYGGLVSLLEIEYLIAATGQWPTLVRVCWDNFVGNMRSKFITLPLYKAVTRLSLVNILWEYELNCHIKMVNVCE